MANKKALSRILSFREPKNSPSIYEAIGEPIDYQHKLKRKTYTPDTRAWLKRATFESPEIDYADLRNACRTEPLFRRRTNRYQNLIWKNGYVLNTEDESAKGYIESRMELFAVLTGKSFDSFLRKVSRELIMFDSCLVLERKLKLSELKRLGVTLPIKGVGKDKQSGPVVAYEVIPIDTIEYKRDEYGNIIQWRQSMLNGKTKEFKADEVIVLKNDEESGDILSFPALQMVLPDARILRQLETDASLAAHRLAFPIFKYKVGDPVLPESIPRKDDDSINDIWYTLEGMLLDGALIMPGTDDFEVVLSDVKLDGLTSVLDYFKSRVILGSGLSPIHIGDVTSANRSVADRLDVQLYDDVKAFQRTLEETVTYSIFMKWLLEGGFNLKLGGDGMSESIVSLEFREIDSDSLIKRENHTLQKWVQDLVDHDEARMEIGRTPISDTSKLYSDLIGGINFKYQSKADKSEQQKTSGGDSQGSETKTKVKKTSSVGEPSAIEEVSSIKELVSLLDYSSSDNTFSILDNIWESLENEVISYISSVPDNSNFDSKELLYAKALFVEDLNEAIRGRVFDSFRFGVDRGFDEALAIDPNVAPLPLSNFNKYVNIVILSLNFYTEKLINDLFDRIETEINESGEEGFEVSVEASFEALHYRLTSVAKTHLDIAENWGVCLVAKHAGYSQVWQNSENACEICKSQWIKVEDLELKSVPPFSTHPHCGCKVHIKK